jgi:hypothetical protein
VLVRPLLHEVCDISPFEEVLQNFEIEKGGGPTFDIRRNSDEFLLFLEVFDLSEKKN